MIINLLLKYGILEWFLETTGCVGTDACGRHVVGYSVCVVVCVVLCCVVCFARNGDATTNPRGNESVPKLAEKEARV